VPNQTKPSPEAFPEKPSSPFFPSSPRRDQPPATMASDDEFYYYYDDDGGEDEEEDEAAADWGGLALEADEDDLGLAEDDPPPRERRADCWVSTSACTPCSAGLRTRAGLRLAEIGGIRASQSLAQFCAPLFLSSSSLGPNYASSHSALGGSLLSPFSNALAPRSSRRPGLFGSLPDRLPTGRGFVSVNADRGRIPM
jgi:hypothetical protein